MPEYLVLNEASFPFTSSANCEEHIVLFFQLLHRAHSKNLRFYRADDLEGSWNSLAYADGFSLEKWLNDIPDRDLMRLVKSVLANVKCPLMSTSPNTELFVLSSNKDIEVKGLGKASSEKTGGISFSSESYWQENPVTILRQWDEEGGIKEEALNVCNIYSLSCIDSFLIERQDERQSKVNYFNTLTEQENLDFPNIIFCASVLKDFLSPQSTTTDLSKIIDSLNKLNLAIKHSKDFQELKNESKLDMSGESSETMRCRKFAKKRIFQHPDIGVQIFEIHVKNFPNGKRMYILPDYKNHSVCIGYFGKHLATVTNST